MMNEARIPLALIATGETVRLANFSQDLPATQKEQLHAYGLVPDCELKVLQRHPMPVVLTNELEIALEQNLARHIWVEKIAI